MQLSKLPPIFFLSLTICLTSLAQHSACKEKDLGSILFNTKSSKLTVKTKKQLDSLAIIIKTDNDSCQVLATASFADFCGECSSLAWDRIQVVFSYLVKRGVSSEKMVFTSSLDRNTNFISLAFATGLGDVPRRHPGFRRT